MRGKATKKYGRPAESGKVKGIGREAPEYGNGHCDKLPTWSPIGKIKCIMGELITGKKFDES